MHQSHYITITVNLGNTSSTHKHTPSTNNTKHATQAWTKKKKDNEEDGIDVTYNEGEKTEENMKNTKAVTAKIR